MPQLQINKQYSDPVPPTASQLDAAYDSIATFFNVTGVGSDNIEDGSISGSKLADNAVTETKILAAAVTTSEFANQSVTLAKLAAAVQQALEPTAAVEPYGGDTAPSGWLLCDGAAYSRTTYAMLFQRIGVKFGSGDGITTFNVPDMRGRMARGVDGAAGRDLDSALRTAMNPGGNVGNQVGSIQNDDTKRNNFRPTGSFDVSGTAGARLNMLAGTPGAAESAFNPAPSHPSTVLGDKRGVETHDKNVYFNWIIKT